MTSETIEDWRRQIDEIDRKLLELFNERSRCAMQIGRLKRALGLPVYQPEREREILENAERLNQGPLDDTAIRRLFERVLDEARSLERLAVAHDGPAAEAPASAPTGTRKTR
ncbi:MAG: chorismate mutase [Candidatus Acidiferrales bacterium]